MFMRRWARWNGVELCNSDLNDLQTQRFRAVDHIPEQMKRYEHWQLEYKRMPYMANFTADQLRERFDEGSTVVLPLHGPRHPDELPPERN